jgi:hypothetical protein
LADPVAIAAENTQVEQVGPGTVAIVAELSAVNAIHRLRAIQGIIRLRKKYGDTRLDAACARALAVGDPRYRTVKGILVAGTEHGGSSPAPAMSHPRAWGWRAVQSELGDGNS